MKMKTLVIALLLSCVVMVHGETLFGPGSIAIAANETLLINTVSAGNGYVGTPRFAIDSNTNQFTLDSTDNFFAAITGPHILHVVASASWSDFFVTYERLTNTPIKTMVFSEYQQTNSIHIPEGRTLQLFRPLGNLALANAVVQPVGSTNHFTVWYRLSAAKVPSHFISGPATLRIDMGLSRDYINGVFSYLFKDDVVELTGGQPGLTEVTVEKSLNLEHWLPNSVYHTDAGSNAFYRLRIKR